MRYALLAVLMLSGCTTSAITMRNPTTGEVAKCGPYGTLGPNGQIAADMQESQCVGDYRQQGFVRAAN